MNSITIDADTTEELQERIKRLKAELRERAVRHGVAFDMWNKTAKLLNFVIEKIVSGEVGKKEVEEWVQAVCELAVEVEKMKKEFEDYIGTKLEK